MDYKELWSFYFDEYVLDHFGEEPHHSTEEYKQAAKYADEKLRDDLNSAADSYRDSIKYGDDDGW